MFDITIKAGAACLQICQNRSRPGNRAGSSGPRVGPRRERLRPRAPIPDPVSSSGKWVFAEGKQEVPRAMPREPRFSRPLLSAPTNMLSPGFLSRGALLRNPQPPRCVLLCSGAFGAAGGGGANTKPVRRGTQLAADRRRSCVPRRNAAARSGRNPRNGRIGLILSKGNGKRSQENSVTTWERVRRARRGEQGGNALPGSLHNGRSCTAE